MNHESSYTETTKNTSMKKQSGTETFMLELYVNMMLQEALLKSEKEKLLLKIDDALDHKNKEKFMKYSKELQNVMKRFGT